MSKKEQINELMVAIRKLSQPSNCIDNFEKLLNELCDAKITDAIICDMNKFIEDFVVLNRSVDKLDDKVLQSKLLTYDFLNTAGNFKRSRSEMVKSLVVLRVLNEKYGVSKTYDFGHTYLIGRLPLEILSNPVGKCCVCEDYDYLLTCDKDEAYETLRRTFLIWNYTPAIVKAIVMTKRRSLGFDANSKRFV